MEYVGEVLRVDRLGFVILEHIFRNPKENIQLGLQEAFSVSCWYIWWQHRKKVKGNHISSATSAAISALTGVGMPDGEHFECVD
jgi:hypothetical protein